MKAGLNLKLGVGIVVLFGLLLAGYYIWTPMLIQYYVSKLRSDNPKVQVAAVDGLLSIGKKGREEFVRIFPDGQDAARFLIKSWDDVNKGIEDEQALKLLHKGKNANHKNISHTNCTYLHLAASEGYIQMAELLIERGAGLEVEASICWGFKEQQAIIKRRLLCWGWATLELQADELYSG